MLHSSTFRKNLTRWIILYIAVICLLTSVVTYSRYISSQTGEDKARTAQFKVDVSLKDICSTTSPGLCNLSSYKPYDTLEYNLEVDTSKMEVLSDLVVNIYIDDNFEILSLYDVNEDEEITFNGYDKTTTMRDSSKLTYSDTYKKLTLVSEAGISNQVVKKYKVDIKFIDTNSYVNYMQSHTYDELVKINYSATQKN